MCIKSIQRKVYSKYALLDNACQFARLCDCYMKWSMATKNNHCIDRSLVLMSHVREWQIACDSELTTDGDNSGEEERFQSSARNWTVHGRIKTSKRLEVSYSPHFYVRYSSSKFIVSKIKPTNRAKWSRSVLHIHWHAACSFLVRAANWSTELEQTIPILKPVTFKYDSLWQFEYSINSGTCLQTPQKPVAH